MTCISHLAPSTMEPNVSVFSKTFLPQIAFFKISWVEVILINRGGLLPLYCISFTHPVSVSPPSTPTSPRPRAPPGAATRACGTKGGTRGLGAEALPGKVGRGAGPAARTRAPPRGTPSMTSSRHGATSKTSRRPGVRGSRRSPPACRHVLGHSSQCDSSQISLGSSFTIRNCVCIYSPKAMLSSSTGTANAYVHRL